MTPSHSKPCRICLPPPAPISNANHCQSLLDCFEFLFLPVALHGGKCGQNQLPHPGGQAVCSICPAPANLAPRPLSVLSLSLETPGCLSSFPVFAPNKSCLFLDLHCEDFIQSTSVCIPSVKLYFKMFPNFLKNMCPLGTNQPAAGWGWRYKGK